MRYLICSLLALLLSAGAHLRAETQLVPDQAIWGNNSFALDLYKSLGKPGRNLFFSPYSITSVMAMVYAGAAGETRAEISEVFHFPSEGRETVTAHRGLGEKLASVARNGNVRLNSANSLWVDNGYGLLGSYLNLLRDNFGGEIGSADFWANPGGAVRTINDWVSSRTQGRIRDIIKPGTISSATRMVLVNALYFKGAWASAFELKDTKLEDFHVSRDYGVKALMMSQVEDFRYHEEDNLQILELPYNGAELSMIIILPREIEGLAGVEAMLTPENLGKWSAGLSVKRLKAIIPRFKMTDEFDLRATLESLGMMDAFNPGVADFSGMDGKKDLYISQVVHKAYVDVNEYGTEAAAATASEMEFLMHHIGTPHEFRADHPFIFLIRESGTGSILFMGRVVNPAL